MRLALLPILAILACSALATPAVADWSGDAKGDVIGVDSTGVLQMFRGNGLGSFAEGAEPVGVGFGEYTAIVAPGDLTGDGRPDLVARTPDGRLLSFRGTGAGGFKSAPVQIATGWTDYTAVLAPGDFSGDGHADLIARTPDGRLVLFAGDGRGGLGAPRVVGAGWGRYTTLLAPGDFTGDGRADLIARTPDGQMLLHRGTGRGGFVSERRPVIARGWQGFTALLAGGDFSGDGRADVLARTPEGALLLYRGDGGGRFVDEPREPLGTDWSALPTLLLAGERPVLPEPERETTTTPSALVRGARLRLAAMASCVHPGRPLRVVLQVRRRAGAARSRIGQVTFFVEHGPRRVDAVAPHSVALRLDRPAGSEGRVFARVAYRDEKGGPLRRRTVSRRFAVCD